MNDAEKLDYAINVQMIFQDPFASLNPRKRVKNIIGEAPLYHGLTTNGELDGYLTDVMEQCGLDPSYKNRYPHQFSGGQRQRIGIARAMAVKPECLVCDESVAALDVSIQAQILNLFMDIREKHNLTCLFISHDLGVVEHISDRISVMYLAVSWRPRRWTSCLIRRFIPTRRRFSTRCRGWTSVTWISPRSRVRFHLLWTRQAAVIFIRAVPMPWISANRSPRSDGR